MFKLCFSVQLRLKFKIIQNLSPEIPSLYDGKLKRLKFEIIQNLSPEIPSLYDGLSCIHTIFLPHNILQRTMVWYHCLMHKHTTVER